MRDSDTGAAGPAPAPSSSSQQASQQASSGQPQSSAPKGGQFAFGGGRVPAGSKSKGAHKQAKPKLPHPPRTHAAAGGGGGGGGGGGHGGGHKGTGRVSATLSFDAKKGAGTGYGIRGGDHRVRTLQQALNRFGMTDATGHKLALDGRYGPRTAAAVKRLQHALGLKETGKVTEAFLAHLAAASSIGDLKTHRHHPAAHSGPSHGSHAAPHHRKATMRSTSTPYGDITAAPSGLEVQVNDGDQAGRPRVLPFDRSYPLDDIVIRSGGDGRTVEAYAAVFDTPYEVSDQHGHYLEVIDRAAFNRTLAHGAADRVAVLYNHGMTLAGTPSDMWSVPIGRAMEIKPDGRGLYTVTRYNMSPEADRVLESIRNGEIRAQSFRGRIFRSNPNAVPRTRPGRALPTITRHELGLSDYGPTPIPVNSGAEIMAVRSITELADEVERLDDDERAELLRTLYLTATPDGDPDAEDAAATPDESGPGAEDPPMAGHSGRLVLARARLRAELIVRGIHHRG